MLKEWERGAGLLFHGPSPPRGKEGDWRQKGPAIEGVETSSAEKIEEVKTAGREGAGSKKKCYWSPYDPQFIGLLPAKSRALSDSKASVIRRR
jgi:hypothetical protein